MRGTGTDRLDCWRASTVSQGASLQSARYGLSPGPLARRTRTHGGLGPGPASFGTSGQRSRLLAAPAGVLATARRWRSLCFGWRRDRRRKSGRGAASRLLRVRPRPAAETAPTEWIEGAHASRLHCFRSGSPDLAARRLCREPRCFCDRFFAPAPSTLVGRVSGLVLGPSRLAPEGEKSHPRTGEFALIREGRGSGSPTQDAAEKRSCYAEGEGRQSVALKFRLLLRTRGLLNGRDTSSTGRLDALCGSVLPDCADRNRWAGHDDDFPLLPSPQSHGARFRLLSLVATTSFCRTVRWPESLLTLPASPVLRPASAAPLSCPQLPPLSSLEDVQDHLRREAQPFESRLCTESTPLGASAAEGRRQSALPDLGATRLAARPPLPDVLLLELPSTRIPRSCAPAGARPPPAPVARPHRPPFRERSTFGLPRSIGQAESRIVSRRAAQRGGTLRVRERERTPVFAFPVGRAALEPCLLARAFPLD